MGGVREYYVKQNKSFREIQIPYDFNRVWDLRKKTNEQPKKRQRRLKYRKQNGGWRGSG